MLTTTAITKLVFIAIITFSVSSYTFFETDNQITTQATPAVLVSVSPDDLLTLGQEMRIEVVIQNTGINEADFAVKGEILESKDRWQLSSADGSADESNPSYLVSLLMPGEQARAQFTITPPPTLNIEDIQATVKWSVHSQGEEKDSWLISYATTLNDNVQLNEQILLHKSGNLVAIDLDGWRDTYGVGPNKREALYDNFGIFSNGIYGLFKDEYDFIFFLASDFTAQCCGLFINTDNSPRSYGAEEKLKGIIVLSSTNITRGPSLHELLHHVATPSGWQTAHSKHWGFAGVGLEFGDPMGGFAQKTLKDLGGGIWQANNGSFDVFGFGTNANGGNSVPYSEFSLYLMGAIQAEDLHTFAVFPDAVWVDQSKGMFKSNNGPLIYTPDRVKEEFGSEVSESLRDKRDLRGLSVFLYSSSEISENNLYQKLDSIAEDTKRFSYPGNDDHRSYNFFEATKGHFNIKMDELQKNLCLPNCSIIGESFPLGLKFSYIEAANQGTGGCGILQDGNLKCWSSADPGRWVPQTPTGKFIDISAGHSVACGINQNNEAMCWNSGGLISYSHLGKVTDIEYRPYGRGLCAVNISKQIVCDSIRRETNSVVSLINHRSLRVSHYFDNGLNLNTRDGPFKSVAINGTTGCGLRQDGWVECFSSNPYCDDISAGGIEGIKYYCSDGNETFILSFSFPGVVNSSGIFRTVNSSYTKHYCHEPSIDCPEYPIEHPIGVPPSGVFVKIDLVGNVFCGLREDHTAECWRGFHSAFTCEDLCTGVRKVAQPPPVYKFKDINYPCGVLLDGQIVCWADEENVEVPEGEYVQTDKNFGSRCGLRVNGTVTCWAARIISQSN